MTTSSKGQMAWKTTGPDGRSLHLRHHASDPWQLYQDFPEYVKSDPPNFSAGYATFLALLKAGWEVIPL